MPTPRQLELKRRSRPRPLDFEQRLKLRLTWLRRLYPFLLKELQTSVRLPLRHRLRGWRMGFTSGAYVLGQLDRNDPSLYLRDFAHRNYDLLDRHRSAIREKLGFSYTLRALGAPHPQPLAFVQEGVLWSLDADAAGRKMTIEGLLERQARLVFRPVGGWGGVGVFFVFKEADGLRVNGKPCSRLELRPRIDALDQYLVTEFLEQADYAATIFPGSPNTLRLLTLWDLEAKEPFLAAACHRIGTERSGVLDNYHQGQGGLSAPIDRETGALGRGVGLDAQGRRVEHERHPDTGEPIEGVLVPRWRETVDQLLRVAAALPHFPYVGWDMLMTERGVYWLEGNSPPGVAVWQVHQPLLAEPRARAFFEWLG